MYSLPQPGCIANDQLQKHLGKCGYRHSKVTKGLWTHATRDTKFTLVVDDFGIRYTSTENIMHLLDALKDLYKITINWTGAHIWIDFEWDYTNRICNMLMKKYVLKALTRFKFQQRKILHIPSLHIVCFSKSFQKPLPPPPTIKEITASNIKFIEQVVGTFLYYGRSVNPTVLHTFSATKSAKKLEQKQP